MPASKEVLLLTLSLRTLEDVVIARQRTRQIMELLQYKIADQTRMTTAVSEMARNACQYAKGGIIRYGIQLQPTVRFFITITDQGTGITHLPSILVGNFRSKTGIGLGIIGTRRLIKDFTIHSNPQQGTHIRLGLETPADFVATTQNLAYLADHLVRSRLKSVTDEVNQQNQELLQALNLLTVSRDELTERVKKRTAELDTLNKALHLEIERRKEIEQSLRAVSERLHLALEAGQIGTWYWSLTTNELTWDAYAASLFGMTLNDFKGHYQAFLELVMHEDRERLQQAFKKTMKENQNEPVEFRVIWPDRSIHYLMARGVVYYDIEHKPLYIIGVYWDITEHRLLNEQMQSYRAQITEAVRKNALGEMASSLAHEINQPLSAIIAYSKGCVKRFPVETLITPEISEVLNEIAEQAERTGKIVHRIKSFIKQGQLFYEQVDLNQLIHETIRFMRHDLALNASLTIYFEESHPPIVVLADKIQLQQVMLNLIRNALEALRDAQIPHPHITVAIFYESETFVRVQVIDNGPGFHETIATQIFEAYFTTKLEGTGLGLNICRSIIEAHGGELSAANRIEGGSCFEFKIPLREETTE